MNRAGFIKSMPILFAIPFVKAGGRRVSGVTVHDGGRMEGVTLHTDGAPAAIVVEGRGCVIKNCTINVAPDGLSVT